MALSSPSGVATAFLYKTQVGGGAGFSSILQATPPSVNPPVIFEPMPSLSAGQMAVWIVVTGLGPNWGGCQIWASVDGGTSYGQMGLMLVGGCQGLLTSTFASGSDPDTVNTLSVDVSESGTQINSGSNTDADLGVTLAYVDGELVGYSTVTLTSTNHYNLGTYLRRGMFDSVVGSHLSGTKFALLGGHVFSQTYPSIMIGTTVNFKFVSFNAVGGQLEDISSVTAYPYTLTGSGLARGIWATPMSVGGKFTDMVLDEWDNNYEIFDVQMPWEVNFKANFGGSPVPGCQIAPVANVSLTFQSVDATGTVTTVGSLTILAGALTGSLSCSAFSVNAGHRLRLYAPAAVDTTIAGLYGTIIGSRD